ncbi:MAG: FtsH protease activity modulator HflK [Planctomycetota bacterium]|jgi:membrane protease subunit HflK
MSEAQGNKVSSPSVRRHPLAWLAGLVLLALLVDFLFTGIWSIQENEQGVVLRFGAEHRSVYPGLVFTLPWPFEELSVVNIKETLKMPVGFRFTVNLDPTPAGSDESEWLTGDMNIVDLEMMIHYTISDPSSYLFRVGPLHADFLIRKCAESVLTETIGVMSVDAILTTEKYRIEKETQERTQVLLDLFEAGLTISRANLQKIAPPLEVIDAFKDVSSAKANRERAIQDADGYRRNLIPIARTQADQIEKQALTYADRVITEARGRAERFRSILAEYKNAEEITRTRLFLETMEEILARPKKIVVSPDEDGRSRVKVIR